MDWVADLQMDVGSGKRKRNRSIESEMDSASDRGSGVDRETDPFRNRKAERERMVRVLNLCLL